MKIVRKPLKDVRVGDVLIDSDARLTTVTGETVEETPSQLFELEILNDDGQKMKVRADSGHAWPLDPGAYGSTPPEAEGETEASTGDIARWVANDDGQKMKVRADSGHAWPLDPGAYGSTPPEAEGETEASTGDIARWVARGWQPQLSPVLTDGTVMHWIVRRALLLPDSVARDTKVKCVRVDSPTHSFMLADNSDLRNRSDVNSLEARSDSIDDGNDGLDGVIHSKMVDVPVDKDLDGGDSVLSLDDLAGMDLDDAPGVMHVDREAFDLITKHGMPTHNCGGPLTLDTLIKTPEGSVTMGSVAVGDKVLNPIGEEAEVLWKSPLMLPEALLRLSIGPVEDPGVQSWSMSDLIYAEMQHEIFGVGVVPSIVDFIKSGAAGGVDLSKMRGPISDGDFVVVGNVDGNSKAFLSDETSLIVVGDRESVSSDTNTIEGSIDIEAGSNVVGSSSDALVASVSDDSGVYGGELAMDEAFFTSDLPDDGGNLKAHGTDDLSGSTDGDSDPSYTVKCDSSHLWTVYDKTMGVVRVVSMNEMFRSGLDNWLIPLINGGWGEILKADVTDPEPVQCKTMGVVRVVSMNEMFRSGLDNWLIPLINGGWGEILKADVTDPEPVQCILVDDTSHDYQLGNGVITHNTGGGKSVLQRWGEILKADVTDPEPVQCILVDDTSHDYQLGNGVITHNTGGGKSVLQRNVVFHVIAHARQIKFFGIDLKKVELSAYRPYSPVLYIATTLEDAVQVLTTAQDLMMSRYAEMEENHVNNFLDLDSPGSALLVMVDEAGELLDCSAPAKALGGGTLVKTLEDGEIPLREVEAGRHHVLGSDLQWHEVVRKYEPESQDHYKVTTVRASDGVRESFVAGSEHLWRVWVPVELRGDLLRITSAAAGESVEDHEDGSVSAVLSTRKLKALKLWRVWVPVELRGDLLRITSAAAGESVEDHEDGSVSAVLSTRKLKALKDAMPDDRWGEVRLRRALES